MRRYYIDSAGVARPAPDGQWVYYSTDVEPLEREIEALRGSLSLAEEGLANYAQENAALRGFLDQFQELLALDPENHPGTDLGRLMLEVGEYGLHPGAQHE